MVFSSELTPKRDIYSLLVPQPRKPYTHSDGNEPRVIFIDITFLDIGKYRCYQILEAYDQPHAISIGSAIPCEPWINKILGALKDGSSIIEGIARLTTPGGESR